MLNNLANALWTQFEQQGQQADVDEAISLYRQPLNLRPLQNSERSLSNLASALRTRFAQRSQKNDLDEAISLYRHALKLFPPPHLLRSTILLLHCGPDFRKVVKILISMKQLLFTDKLSTSSFHPIQIDLTHSIILLTHSPADLSKKVS